MIKKNIIFFWVLFSINFFEFKDLFNNNFIIYLRFLFLFLFTLYSLRYFLCKNIGFIFPVKLISVAILFSMLMAYYSWDQDLVSCLKATLPYMSWICFFYLINNKISIKTVENIVVVFGVLYIIFYLFQFANSKTVYFGLLDEFGKDRGITRINFPGSGLFYLLIFMSICKFTEKANYRWFWLTLTIIGPVITILQVTRQTIGFVVLIYLFHFIRVKNKIFRVLGLLIIMGGILVFIYSENSVYKGLLNSQNETISDGTSYIRVLAGQYYLTEYSPNLVSKLFGNGVSYGISSKMGQKIDSLSKTNYFYLDDMGIIAVYAMFGLIAVIGFILVWIKSFRYSLHPRYFYTKYYIWFLLFTSLTSNSLFNYNYIAANIFAVVIYHIVVTKNSQNKMRTKNNLNLNINS